MAMAVGMMLARAALAPSPGDDGGCSIPSKNSDRIRCSVGIVLPTATEGGDGRSPTPSWAHGMLLGDIDGGGDGPSTSNEGASSPLEVHRIAHDIADNIGGAASMDTDDAAVKSPDAKRPRGGEKTVRSSSGDGDSSRERRELVALAGAAAAFLLGDGTTAEDGSRPGTDGGGNFDGGNFDGDGNAPPPPPPIRSLQGPGGVMLLVMSLVETRGVDRIRRDMDDPNATITSQFGHSSQELMNLLLTGQAVSNVFDDSMTLSEELTCHGIQGRPAVGYLSILESLRYCEVGSYYKNPLFPIWVVGSTSHFSVLFGDERCLQESKSDILLEKCRRAFKKVEGGSENGFIPVDRLGEVLDELDLRSNVGGDSGVQTLQAYLEVSGAGIILWDEFWKAGSRLMTGSSLESVVSSRDDLMQVDDGSGDGPPLLITQFGHEDGNAGAVVAAAAATALSSDEELARKLAAEWGSMPDQGSSAPATATATAAAGNAKSDEDYARELQARWDAEEAGGNDLAGMDFADLTSQVATTDDVATLASGGTDSPVLEVEVVEEGATDSDTKRAAETAMNKTTDDGAQSKSKPQQLDFEKHGLSFPLYHYNGLYGGTLTPFRLTRLSPTEAVGASIALSSRGGSGHGAGGGDLEDVVRTKWPSSMLNWFGKNPPSID